MPIPAATRSSAEFAISEYCVGRVRPGLEHLIEITYRFEANNLYLTERRPSYRRKGPWTQMDIAKFRYMVGSSVWILYWSDRNGRWHRYEGRRPARRLQTLLRQVEADPTGIFWG